MDAVVCTECGRIVYVPVLSHDQVEADAKWDAHIAGHRATDGASR